MELFLGRELVKNNLRCDQLDTEKDIILRLQNRILMLFFGSAECSRCMAFAPTLKEFFKQLTNPFYVERSSQLTLIYISLDDSEDLLDTFMEELPKKTLYLMHDDPYRRELESMFEVEELPQVVVLRPDCSVLSSNAVQEIVELGTDCFLNWHEGGELINRNFLIGEEYEDRSLRSITDPLRRLKYWVDYKKKKKTWWGVTVKRRNEEEEEDGAGEEKRG